MKHEKLWTFVTAGTLAFLTARGIQGCLTTAFGLNLEHPAFPVLLCALAAYISAALFSFRYGGTAVLCLLALAAGYIHRDGTALEQFLQLVHRLTTVYDRAYGWGVLTFSELPWDSGFSDWPLGIIGSLAALTVTRTVVRQTSTWLPVLATLLPLSACIVVTDTVPEEGWMLTVMACLILLVLTADLRRENGAQGVRLMAAAALPVIAALWGLFQMFPQDSYVNQSQVLRENILIATQNIPRFIETGMNQIASSLQTQPARQVDLAGLGARIPFTYPVMEVTAQHSGTLYLRQQDYDLYDGLGWTASEGRRETFPAAAENGESILIRTGNRKNTLFLPYYPTLGAELENGYAENREDAREYTILRSTLPEDWRQRAYENTANSPEEWQEYLNLPDATRQGALDYLAQLPAGTLSNTAKADLIAALVLDSARYDLDPGKMPAGEGDFALWFLEDADRGYCVHFATAATVLLRASGVPARYVTGYMLEAVAGEAVTVTEENAHAWAEYYEPNLGLWLPLEVTPADEAPLQVLRPQTVPPETTAATEPVVETTAPATEAPAETTPPPESTAPEAQAPVPSEPVPPAQKQTFPLGLLLLPLLPCILATQRSVRLALRRWRQQRGDANHQALQRWREAELLSRLLKESPTEELMALAQKAKFSQYELTAEELAQFDSFSRTCLRRLRKKPWYLRLIYKFIYAAY